MIQRTALIIIFFALSVSFAAGQIKVRLYSSHSPNFVVFTVVDGEYTLEGAENSAKVYRKNDNVVISIYNNKLAIKPRQSEGFVVDKINFKAKSDNSSFSLRINTQTDVAPLYNGDLLCYQDFSTIVMINTCNIEDYIAGVIKAESGVNSHKEYAKTQAIITRTYLYKNSNRHIEDGYNFCDDTHCQAFHGITNDHGINLAAKETKGLVILDKDSALIISSFHSNCGGMTAASKDVWVTDLPYLRSISDPYCVRSRNAEWERIFTLNEWAAYLQKFGYKGARNDAAVFTFYQSKRTINYKIGTFYIPFEKIRSDFRLKSSFFSIIADNNSIILKGKGYGHGVGLCQEGAMVMATRGSNYKEIISFYYPGVLVTDLKNAKSVK